MALLVFSDKTVVVLTELWNIPINKAQQNLHCQAIECLITSLLLNNLNTIMIVPSTSLRLGFVFNKALHWLIHEAHSSLWFWLSKRSIFMTMMVDIWLNLDTGLVARTARSWLLSSGWYMQTVQTSPYCVQSFHTLSYYSLWKQWDGHPTEKITLHLQTEHTKPAWTGPINSWGTVCVFKGELLAIMIGY